MRTPRRTRVAAVVLASALAGCGGGDRERAVLERGNAEPDVTVDATWRDGGVVGGPERFRAEAGDVVRITVTSDEDDEVHVHGVDVSADVAAGQQVDLTFRVEHTGAYEVELHESGALLGTLEVR